jgi:hypothetical protein
MIAAVTAAVGSPAMTTAATADPAELPISTVT